MKLFFENIELKVPNNHNEDINAEEFLHFCEQNKNVRIERNATKQIFISHLLAVLLHT